jgi:hypothetical protein
VVAATPTATHTHRGERGETLAAQHAKRVRRVLREIGEHSGPSLTARELFVDGDALGARVGNVAEALLGQPARVGRAQAAREVFVGAHRQVEAELFVHVGGGVRAPETQVSPPGGPFLFAHSRTISVDR